MDKSAASVGDIAQQIIKDADILYEFVLKYSASMYLPIDYGTGDKLNMIEAHLLTYIDEHPGITGTELAKLWNRTKGAISQQVKKLVSRGYVRKEKQDGNAKIILLYVTEKGRQISLAHKMHDVVDITQTLQILSKTCTIDEIMAFYKVVSGYVSILDEE